ncbi:MAG TPA: VanZ family protein [Candidatus Binataceae bacterium]|nr:VanZ family protein [Candidatus Binataceae bacterium]
MMPPDENLSGMQATRAESIHRFHHSPWRFWIAPLLWITMIAFGGGDFFSSAHTYVWLTHLLAGFHLPFRTLGTVNHALRKIGHFCVYAVLSILLFRAWRETLSSKNPLHSAIRSAWSMHAAVLAIACSALIASLDEFHQSFTPSRGPAVRDVVLDTFGALFAQMLLVVLFIGRSKSAAVNGVRPRG